MKTFKFMKKLLVLAMILIASSPQMQAWNSIELCGDPTGGWSNYVSMPETGDNTGVRYMFIYMVQNQYFKFRWAGSKPVGNNDNLQFTAYNSGGRMYKWDSGDPAAAIYKLNTGIVRVCTDQTSGNDSQPWVWLLRPTIHIRHNWNGSGWSDQDMTDNNNGTYSFNGNWGGNYTYVGVTDMEYNADGSNCYKKFQNIGTVYGNPSTGDYCAFEYNAEGYRGTTNSTSYTGTLTIRVYCTITYNGNNKTSGSVPTEQSSQKAGISMTLRGNTGSLARTGYTLTGWNTKADGTGDHYDLSGSYTPNAKSITLYAEWTANTYTAANNIKDASNTNKGQYTATYDATTIAYNTKPSIASGYSIEGLYATNTAGTLSNKIVNGETALVASTSYTDGSRKWNYTSGSPTLYVKYAPNTYTISFDADDSGRPGTATNVQSNVTVTFDNNNFSAATVKVPVLAGYTFGGYYTAKDGEGVQIVDAEGAWQSSKTNYLDGSGNWIKAANTTLYAKWTAETYTVTFNATQNGGTCATTSTVVTMGATYGEGTGLSGSLPTASAPSGYRFAGWYTAATDGTKIENTTVVSTANDHTLYAHFTAISYVYFYNNLGWSEVYVAYDATWHNEQGAGNNGKTYHKMTQIDDTNIYRDEIPSDVIASWKYNIAFNSKQLGSTPIGTYTGYNSGSAVFRRDFDSNATMFVPYTTKDYDKNDVTYYSTDQWVDKDGDDVIDYRYMHGYWMKYNQYMSGDAGYVIKGKWDNESSDFYFKKVTEGNSYTVTKYLPASTTYKFRIYKHCKTSNTYSSWFIGNKDATITSSITNWTLSTAIDKGHTDWYDQLTTTIAGDYEFKITCGTDGEIKLSVTYPGLTVDDHWYRLLYTWNDGSTHSRVCETFRRIANGGTEGVDAFIHKASYVNSQSLKLQKYVTVSSTPTWQDVQTITLPSDKITKNGVYSFLVTRPSGSEASCSFVCPYEEDFYLRSDVTAGGWDYYTDIAFGGTQNMTYSEFSAQQATDPYNYYYCLYVDNDKQNVAFTIATLNTPSICDTLVGDDIIGAANNAATYYKHLPTNNPANIRFMYNDSTNTIKRAYLKSAQGSGRSRFLVLHGNTKVFNTDETAVRPDSLGLTNDELIFVDKGNWVYEISLKASPIAKAKVIAQYNGSDRYLIGAAGDEVASTWKTILGAPVDDLSHKYALAGTYDFKNNRLILAWTPDGTDITAKLSDVDMLWIREGDDAATQINFGEGGELQKVTAVGAIKINWSDVNGKVGTWNAYTRTYAKYFVSFPFDVNVSDIFGLNKAVLGREYIIQKYNGAKRAEEGLFDGDGATFWENLTVDSVMHANEGYIVMFDNDYLNSDSWPIWDNNKGAGKSIYLYFPAAALVSSISNAATTTTVAAHQSERKETWTDGSGTHKMSDTDSHWNLIGGPFFHNATISSSTPGAGLSALHAYYSPNKADNTWVACVLGTPKVKDTDVINNAFKAMSCIMVQWHGTLTWNTTSTTPALVAARNAEDEKNYLIQLDLQQGEDYSDHAFVDLKDGANSEFVLCEDMMKIVRNGKPNVYVYSGAYDVAYSQVPVVSQTIPVGVIIPQDGTYTFTMPTNFDGTVTLVDTFEQTRTNLGLGDYELYLDRGTINDRFYLEIDIHKVPTAIDGAEDGSGSLKDGKAHKFIENGIMYILKDGEIFDARGTHIK